MSWYFFFFNYTATTEIYTLSLHDALPIFIIPFAAAELGVAPQFPPFGLLENSSRIPLVEVAAYASQKHSGLLVHSCHLDRKSTRLNSSHANISYAVFCLKKKKQNLIHIYS